MEVTPKTLREAEFREVKRGGGYLCEDVDDFIEEVAKGVEALHERLRQAVERAQRAESAASEVTSSDETLRRTLVLAQRTADLAVQEAREQAARILAGAEQQAQAILGEAEQHARRTRDEAVAATRDELSSLESARARAQAEVDALERWAAEQRAMIVAGLREAAAVVEKAGGSPTPPGGVPADSAQPAEEPTPPEASADTPEGHQLAAPSDEPAAASPTVARASSVAATTPATGSASGAGDTGHQSSSDFGSGPPTMAWHRANEAGERTGEVPIVVGAPVSHGGDIDEKALNDFFDDPSYADDRRFSARLRRRR